MRMGGGSECCLTLQKSGSGGCGPNDDAAFTLLHTNRQMDAYTQGRRIIVLGCGARYVAVDVEGAEGK